LKYIPNRSRRRMKVAYTIIVSDGDQTKVFSRAEFHKIMRSSEFVAAVTFWRSLEQLATTSRPRMGHPIACDGVLAGAPQESIYVWCRSPISHNRSTRSVENPRPSSRLSLERPKP
jgi:hypothetical protein